jgi:hypothetical protein
MINTIFITSLSKYDKEIFNIDSLQDKVDQELKVNILGKYDVNSASSFKKKLEEIQSLDIEGSLLLQINLHGYNDFTGVAFLDDSGLNWNEFDDLLREINRKVKRKLAVCYGLHLKRIIDNYPNDLRENRNSPFREIFASKTPVFNYEFNNLFCFYKSISETLDIEKGIKSFKENFPNTKMEYQDLYLGAIEFINSKSSINLPIFNSHPETKRVKEELINGVKKFFLIEN